MAAPTPMPILAPCDRPLLLLAGAAVAGMVMPPGLKLLSDTLLTVKPAKCRRSESIRSCRQLYVALELNSAQLFD